MKKISVIIPCYNVENYLDRCMETIVNQTIGIENLEVILVNDASTDGTLDKMKVWEDKYPEDIMLVTYEQNIRQGGARNVGMSYASCDYIGFVDSDDWIELDMYENLYRIAVEGDYDCVKGKFERNESIDDVHIYNEPGEDQEYHFECVDGFYVQEIDKIGNIGIWGGYVQEFIKSL